jgi:methionine synthase II (cobalamin-independent)
MERVIGRATGIGSWPGQDVQEAQRAVFGLLGEAPHLPHLPELPQRGPGAELIGRGAGLLVDMPVDLQPSGWRLVHHPGRDQGRARSWLRQDLDVLAEVADGYTGPLKLQVTGPWTLAASVNLPRLERAVVDRGACRDLIASLAEGVRQHLAEVRRLVPGAELVLQLDEPSLPAVLAGGLPTASGFGRLRAVDEPVVIEGLQAVLAAAGDADTVIHCCAPAAPLDVLARTGAGALALDVALLDTAGWERVAVAIESGTALWAGVRAGASARPDDVADTVWTPWRTLGLSAGDAGAVVLTPSCGLAGVAPAVAPATLRALTAAAADLAERSQG